MTERDHERNDMNREYVEAYVPDKIQLAAYVNIAKGSERTMAQFANACGVSASTLSRIANYKITKPLSVELVQSIVKNAVDPKRINYESIMRANGMIPKDRQERRDPAGNHFMERHESRMELGANVENTIMQELYARGHMLQFFSRLPFDEMPKSRFGLRRYSAFAIHIQGYEPRYWNFVVNSMRFRKDDDEQLSEDKKMFIRMTMDRYAPVFLQDAWEPESMKDIKTTFVLVDSEAFALLKDLLGHARVNTEMSIILVDTEKREVVTEFSIPRKDGKRSMSIFMEDKIAVSDEDDDFEMWYDPDNGID